MFRKALPVLAVSFALAAGCSHTQVPLPSLGNAETVSTDASVQRGQSIVRDAAVCGHCHAADPQRDPDGPLSGGMEFRNWRLGVARASNLTPDAETGLGAWSEAEIVRALRNGQRRDGRLLAPVMPYEWFHEMSDADALAVARYLESLPPVRNAVTQSPNLAFKFGRTFLLRPKPALSVPAQAAGATASYGGYLAQHVALCADCHTPRHGLMQTPDRSRLFAGTSNPPKGFPANPSNLTPDTDTGIGGWSENDFVQTIRTGKTPDGRELHPIMPWHQNRRMSDDDLRAIYRYLRTLPPIRNAVVRRPAA
jgi:mono/diheme cytochrome c family protein